VFSHEPRKLGHPGENKGGEKSHDPLKAPLKRRSKRAQKGKGTP